MAVHSLARRPGAPRLAVPRPRTLLPLVLPLLLLGLWQASVPLGLVKAHQLPPPAAVFDGAVSLFNRGLLQQHLLATASRVLAGFSIGASVAVFVAMLVGLSRTAERAVDPTLQAVRTVPSLAWAPLLLLWLGIDEPPKVALISIGAFFPVYVNLVAGIRGVDRKLVEVGRIYNLSAVAIARRIVLPSSLPGLLTGLRLGLSQAWLFVVAAELIAASRGLGFLLTDAQNTARVDLVLVAMLSLALLGKLTDSILRTLEERLLRWRDTLGTEAAAR